MRIPNGPFGFLGFFWPKNLLNFGGVVPVARFTEHLGFGRVGAPQIRSAPVLPRDGRPSTSTCRIRQDARPKWRRSTRRA